MPAAPEPRRVLVTGGTGFVGSNLVRRLLADGHEVALLVRRGYDAWRLADLSGSIEWIEANLADSAGVRSLIAGRSPQWIFHLAVYGAYSWQLDSETMVMTNVLGTANLLDACLATGFEAFVNTGSSSEYGFKDHPPQEDEALEPNSAYAVTKAAATWYCGQAARATGAPITTLRLYSAYGPWEEPRRFIPRLVACGLEGRLPPLAAPTTARDFVYIDDVCDAYVRAAVGAPDPGAVYNVASGIQTTLEGAVAVARRVFDIAAEPSWSGMPDRGWDTATWVGDSTRIRECLGWHASVDLEQGLRRTAEWLKRRPEVAERYLRLSS